MKISEKEKVRKRKKILDIKRNTENYEYKYKYIRFVYEKVYGINKKTKKTCTKY